MGTAAAWLLGQHMIRPHEHQLCIADQALIRNTRYCELCPYMMHEEVCGIAAGIQMQHVSWSSMVTADFIVLWLRQRASHAKKSQVLTSC